MKSLRHVFKRLRFMKPNRREKTTRRFAEHNGPKLRLINDIIIMTNEANQFLVKTDICAA